MRPAKVMPIIDTSSGLIADIVEMPKIHGGKCPGGSVWGESVRGASGMGENVLGGTWSGGKCPITQFPFERARVQ